VPVTAGGWVDPAGVAEAIGPGTQLVSIMHVNNETGVIQDVQAIGATCRDHGVLFHVDAAQSAGKVPLDLKSAPIDLCSLTAHKLCGPQGCRRSVRCTARDARAAAPRRRAGAFAARRHPATHQVVGIGKTYELAEPEREAPRYAALRDIASIEEAQLIERILALNVHAAARFEPATW
jgi:cysteine desulfurase